MGLKPTIFAAALILSAGLAKADTAFDCTGLKDGDRVKAKLEINPQTGETNLHYSWRTDDVMNHASPNGDDVWTTDHNLAEFTLTPNVDNSGGREAFLRSDETGPHTVLHCAPPAAL